MNKLIFISVDDHDVEKATKKPNLHVLSPKAEQIVEELTRSISYLKSKCDLKHSRFLHRKEL